MNQILSESQRYSGFTLNLENDGHLYLYFQGRRKMAFPHTITPGALRQEVAHVQEKLEAQSRTHPLDRLL